MLVKSLNVELVNVILKAITFDHKHEDDGEGKTRTAREYKSLLDIHPKEYMAQCIHNLTNLEILDSDRIPEGVRKILIEKSKKQEYIPDLQSLLN